MTTFKNIFLKQQELINFRLVLHKFIYGKKIRKEKLTQTASNIDSLNKMKRSRTKSQPAWFGERANGQEFSDGSEPDPFASDDSIEDRNYVQSPSKRFKGSTEKTSGILTKSSNASKKTVDLDDLELNCEFDQIKSSSSAKHMGDRVSSQSKLDKYFMNKERTCSREPPALNQLPSVEKSTVTSQEQRVQSTQNKLPDSSDCSVSKIDTQLVQQLVNYSVEILERISVIEKSLIRNKILTPSIGMDNVNQLDVMEHVHVFMKSNDLPLGNIEHVKTFNDKLVDQAFKKTAVRFFLISNIK